MWYDHNSEPALKLAGSLARPVVAPARRCEQVSELGAQRRRATDVPHDRGDLVEPDLKRVERLDVLREPEANTLGLERECAEQLVPDDEDARVVLVEVADVLA